jgi:CheY-like chemotaxis protein
VSRFGGALLNAERNTDPEAAVRTVLVVEDEVLTRMVIAEILRDTGFRVVEAGNAA